LFSIIRGFDKSFAVLAALAAFWVSPAWAQETKVPPGAYVYKQAGCITCHKWHGMGGPGYGGTPINFRESFLDREQLIEVVACGRPGTGMPYHNRDAYKKYDCYEGMTLEEMDEEDRPGRSRAILTVRQIKHVSEFILEHFEGRDNTLVRADCEIFFGTGRTCRKLQAGGGGGGGGGH
jgi:hypothetical protein